MKIENNVDVGKLTPSIQQKAVDTATSDETPKPGDAGDQSRVSALAKQIARAREAARELPDVRAQKIAVARNRLESGFYDTAEAREVLVEKLAALLKDIASR